MIDTLPDDLLVQILLLVPTKDAVATMILSRRWLSIWTMMPILDYKESNDVSDDERKSVWRFLNESLKLHKAPVLESVFVELGPQCPVDQDVGKWVTNVIDRNVRTLTFELNWSAKPIKLPNGLYTCNTLATLHLSGKILVDISSPASLPSLTELRLFTVIFKDEDSLVGLLSSCPNLDFLHVNRHSEDNVRHFKVKVPSLECLAYEYRNPDDDKGDIRGSLVIDSPALKRIAIIDLSGDSYSIEETPSLEKAAIHVVYCSSDMFLSSSLIHLNMLLNLPMVKYSTTTNFSHLVECWIKPTEFDWLNPVMVLVQNSPKLKLLHIDQDNGVIEDSPLSWNRPNCIPQCLSTHLEIFEWKEYIGKSNEKELVRYILANSRCLKRVAISLKSTCNLEDQEKSRKELDSMSRISQSSQLTYTPIFPETIII